MTDNESDNADNKNSPVRLPDELRRELRREAFERGQRSGKEPTFGSLLLEAWRAYKAIANSGDQQLTKKSNSPFIDSAVSPRLDSGVSEIAVPEDDAPWVHKLLTVRHSKKPGLPTAVENNLNEFVWADLAFNELQKHKSPLVSFPAAGAGGRGAAPAKLARVTGDRSHGSGDPGPQGDLDPAMDTLEENQRERQKGKKNAPGKTG